MPATAPPGIRTPPRREALRRPPRRELGPRASAVPAQPFGRGDRGWPRAAADEPGALAGGGDEADPPRPVPAGRRPETPAAVGEAAGAAAHGRPEAGRAAVEARRRADRRRTGRAPERTGGPASGCRTLEPATDSPGQGGRRDETEAKLPSTARVLSGSVSRRLVAGKTNSSFQPAFSVQNRMLGAQTLHISSTALSTMVSNSKKIIVLSRPYRSKTERALGACSFVCRLLAGGVPLN